MGSKNFGARVTRFEDAALVSGKGRYVDDIHIPGTLACRVPAQRRTRTRGSARSKRPRRGAARACIAVLTAADLAGADAQGADAAAAAEPDDDHVTRRSIAWRVDEVCYVGEPLAIVVADSRYLAEDAAGGDRNRVRGAAQP